MPAYRIAQKHVLTDRIAAFALAPLRGCAPQWSAGAHVDIDLGGAGTRSYSLIHWPGQPRHMLHIAVQAEPDGQGGSLAMHALEVGTEIDVSDPKNSFALQPTAKPIALLAGGIGVTPLISMATELSATGTDFVFHYTGRSAAVMGYLPDLKAQFADRLTCHTDDAAPMDLVATVTALKDHAFYICGPKGMIDAARSAAEAAGVPSNDIHVELFASPDAGGEDTGFEVELAASNAVVSVAPGQSIIQALEAAGHDVMYDCQRGDCGICQVDVLDGTPDHRDVVLSDAEKASGKVMQICVSRSKTARLVLDI